MSAPNTDAQQGANNLQTRSQSGGRSSVQDPSSSNSRNTRRPGISHQIPPQPLNAQQRIVDPSFDFAYHPETASRPLRPVHASLLDSDPVRLRRRLDKVFNTYGERLRDDLRDMHGICTQLIAQGEQEKAKWYALCAKVMLERDHARQRVNALTYEQRNNVRSQASSPSAEDQNMIDLAGRLSSKRRGREVYSSDITLESHLDTGCSARSASPISTENLRPMRSLRLSPVRSPPPATPSSPGLSSMSPPSSSSSSDATISPPGSSSLSAFSPFEQRTLKRRKSCDVVSHLVLSSKSEPASYLASSPPRLATNDVNVRIKQQSRTPSPLTTIPPNHAEGDFLASNFSHVDLMYVSANGSFVCRACLLKSKSQASFSTFEPKAFPSTTASWDQLRDHCVGMHPEACADVARLQPAEIFELRRRLSSI